MQQDGTHWQAHTPRRADFGPSLTAPASKTQVREQAKGKIPALKAARSHNTSMALLFAVIVAVLIVAVLR